MGATCTPAESTPQPQNQRAHLKPAASMHMLLKNETGDYQIENSNATLEIGRGLTPITMDIISQLDESCKSFDRYKQLLQKHNTSLYFWCVVSYVAKGDGILGEKERRFIKDASSVVHFLSNKDFDVVVQCNKNYVNEYVASLNKVWQQYSPKMSRSQKEDKIWMGKQLLLFFTILTASQDGVAKREFRNINELCKTLKLQENNILEFADMVQLEIDLASKVAQTFTRTEK